MAFEKMTDREQVLIFIVICTFVLGGYGLFRYFPEHKILSEMNAQLQKNKESVAHPVFPDEPYEDIEDLKEKQAEIDANLNGLLATYDNYEKSLAPTDSQEMILKISDAARVANVKIIENVPYLVTRVAVTKNEPPSADLSKLTPLQQRSARKRAIKKQRALNAAGVGMGAQGTAPKEGELIYRVVNEMDEARPLQKMTVEGTFAEIQSFMLSLANMPYQTTIMKLDLSIKIQTPPPGMPQPLSAKMIVAI